MSKSSADDVLTLHRKLVETVKERHERAREERPDMEFVIRQKERTLERLKRRLETVSEERTETVARVDSMIEAMKADAAELEAELENAKKALKGFQEAAKQSVKKQRKK